MLTLLEDAIKAYSILENTTYKIVLGKLVKNTVEDGSLIELMIPFNSENFFHLFGFQYLENLNGNVNKKVMFKGLRTLVYKNQPLTSNRYYSQIISSPSFSSDLVKNRLEVIKCLPYFLDTFAKKNTYWKYSGFKGIVTDIRWDYLILLASEESDSNQDRYLFLRKDEQESCLAPISTFLSHRTEIGFKDYKQGQERYDILGIEKICFRR